MTFLPSKGARCLQGLDHQDPPGHRDEAFLGAVSRGRRRASVPGDARTWPSTRAPGSRAASATKPRSASTSCETPLVNHDRPTTVNVQPRIRTGEKKGGNVFYSPTLPKPGKAKPCGCWCWWEESSRTLQDGHGEAGSTAVVWGAGHTTTCHLSDMQITLS